jgi:hypothetical protein
MRSENLSLPAESGSGQQTGFPTLKKGISKYQARMTNIKRDRSDKRDKPHFYWVFCASGLSTL